MGKIFGISDNPVTLPTTPFEPIYVPKPQYVETSDFNKFTQQSDKFVCSTKTKNTMVQGRVNKFLNRLIKASLKK